MKARGTVGVSRAWFLVEWENEMNKVLTEIGPPRGFPETELLDSCHHGRSHLLLIVHRLVRDRWDVVDRLSATSGFPTRTEPGILPTGRLADLASRGQHKRVRELMLSIPLFPNPE